jgi:hypothetical protein
MSIAEVDYVDIVATKDPETKAVLYYSAFVRLIKWGPERFPAYEFDEKKMFKIFLGRYSSDSAEKYWILYPNKNPLPRTRVNVHQLAASTEKLFENAEQLTETVLIQKAEIESLKTANNECITKLAAAETQIASMMANVAYLMQQFEPREDKYKRESEAKEMHLLFAQQSKDEVSNKRQTQSEQKELVSIKKVDADDCMFSKPVRQFKDNCSYIVETPLTKSKMTLDELESDFLTQLDASFPVQYFTINTATEAKIQCSRDFCGNQ